MSLIELAPAIFVPLIVFTFAAVVIIVPLVLRAQEKARLHNTIARYHERGETPPAELFKTLAGGGNGLNLDALLNRPNAELRRGLILIAVAMGMIIFGMVIDAGGSEWEIVWPIVGASAFPGLIGVASLIMWQVGKNAPKA